MKLRQLIKDLNILETNADLETEISSVCYDSRKAQPGSLFVAIKGTRIDGNQFLSEAVEKGACAVVTDSVFIEEDRKSVV